MKKIKSPYHLGQRAFLNGLDCKPFRDKKLLDTYLVGLKKEEKVNPIIKNWIKGWNLQNKIKNKYKKYKVKANNVEDFLEKYYKPERYKGRGNEYAKILLNSYINEFNNTGYCFISNHDSITGKVVSYFEG